MKLSSLAIALITTTNLLIYINITDSAKAQDSTSNQGFFISLSEQTKNDSWERNNDPIETVRMTTMILIGFSPSES